MKQLNMKIGTSLFVGFILGFLGYIPVYVQLPLINELYFEYGLVIISIFFVYTIVISNFLKSSFKYVFPALFFALILLTGSIRVLMNQHIVSHNDGKAITEFNSPYVGYKLILDKDQGYQFLGNAMFVYGDHFMTFNSLVFQEEHGYNMKSFDGDQSLQEIYNADWWRYYHGD